MINHETYMQRCLDLALLGAGAVTPNPMVGAVLVHSNRIIGEGYHKQYGQAHAEVNCINSVVDSNINLISDATLYVSLEPCAHYGKTPPCADLLIKHKIPKVVVGCRDPFSKVNGKGIEKLKEAGVEVLVNVLENECKALNARFFTYHIKRRPYVVLKWAQSGNQKIGGTATKRIFISNEFSNRLVHKWRSEEAAILVGTNTALLDDPSLNNRLWSGANPIRLVVDLELKLPHTLNVFNRRQPTIIFNKVKDERTDNFAYVKISGQENLVYDIMQVCYAENIQSILVEGGAALLQTFMQSNVWDEARVIENTSLIIDEGLNAPTLTHTTLSHSEIIFTDIIRYYTNNNSVAITT